MVIMMAGLDYSRASIELREQLSFTRAQAGALAGRVRQQVRGVLGAVLLSTCNRTELYLSCERGESPEPGEVLCRMVGLDYLPFADSFVTRRGSGAARHLMEVAGGLKSQIWGEDQILTQVKGAIALAREYGAADPVLEALFRNAAAAGKEIKSKVRLTGVSTSAAARAVEVLRRELGELAGKRALVIGNGEMGRLSCALLRDAGCAVTMTLRTYRHGETVVPAGCGVASYDERLEAMEGVDILLSATTSPHYTVTAGQLLALSDRPRYVVDLAMPRDVEPAAADVPGVTLYNVDTLGCGVRRDKVPGPVLDILDDYMGRFYEWHNYRKCLPCIEELKTAITERVLNYPEAEEGIDSEDMAQLAVSTAVDLLTGGLKEKFGPEDLERCLAKIRNHTAVRSREKERSDGEEKPIPFPVVC